MKRPGVSLGYQPGLDGLRAIGVLGVLLFHADFDWARGGWLGVSTFFTLSGFLITTLLLTDHVEHGGVRFANFWSRRARRLLPAAWAALALAVLFGATVADAGQLARLQGDVLAALAYVANWRFMATDASYADLFRAPSPVLHFWSLAIEEQFYLFFPVVVAGLFSLVRRSRGTADAHRRRLALSLAVGAAVSTMWMIWLDQGGATVDRLYYGTDTRMAELLTGATAAAFLHGRTTLASPRRRQAVSALGGLALVTLLALYATTSLASPWVYRGGLQLVALLGVTVVIAAVQPAGAIARLLAIPPLRRLGLISYGVYLFHWPIYLWLQSEGWRGWRVLLVGGGLAIALAVLSYHLLEQPIRHARAVLGTARYALPPLVIVGLLGASALVSDQPPPNDPLALLAEAEAEGIAPAPTAAPPTVPGIDRPLRLLVVGDRPAGDLVPALSAADPLHLEVRDATGIPCGDHLVAVNPDDPESTTCAGWAAAWRDEITTFDPDVTLMMPAHWSTERLLAAGGSDAPAADDPDAPTWVRRRLDAAADLLSAGGGSVAVGIYPHPLDRDQLPDIPRSERDALSHLHDVAVAHPSADLIATADELPTAGGPGWAARSAEVLVPRLLSLGAEQAETTESMEPRVMVVGDSVSWFLGRGLERWSREHDALQVWNTGTLGCGIARGGVLQLSGGPTPSDPVCDNWQDRWGAQLDDYDPDTVVVLSGLWELIDRRLEGWEDFDHVGSARFDDYLVDEYTQAVDLLSADGAEVVWLVPPCYADVTFPGPVAQTGALDPERRQQLVDRVLPRLIEARPDVELADLAGLVCPDGVFTQDFGGMTLTRPDGVHFSDEAALAVAEWLAPQLADDETGPTTSPPTGTSP